MNEDGEVYVDTHPCVEQLSVVALARTLTWPIRRDLCGGDINDLLQRIKPLLEVVHRGHTIEWNGTNAAGQLTDQAMEACEEIDSICDACEPSHVCVQHADDFVKSEAFDIYSDWPSHLSLEEFVHKMTDDCVLGELGDAILEDAKAAFEGVYLDPEDEPLPDHVLAALLENEYISEEELRQYKEDFDLPGVAEDDRASGTA